MHQSRPADVCWCPGRDDSLSHSALQSPCCRFVRRCADRSCHHDHVISAGSQIGQAHLNHFLSHICTIRISDVKHVHIRTQYRLSWPRRKMVSLRVCERRRLAKGDPGCIIDQPYPVLSAHLVELACAHSVCTARLISALAYGAHACVAPDRSVLFNSCQHPCAARATYPLTYGIYGIYGVRWQPSAAADLIASSSLRW